MKITARSLRLFVLAGALTGVAYSQAMIQYGTAAATGAAAGAAAGKKVSDALTGVMNNAAKAAQTDGSADVAAAEAKIFKQEAKKAEDYKSVTAPANMPSAGGSGPSAPSGSAGPVSRGNSKSLPLLASAELPLPRTSSRVPRRAAAALKPSAPAEQTEAILEPASPELPWFLLATQELHATLAPMSERLQRIVPGSSRDDLKRILGTPASRVLIPGERDLNEIYYYQEKGRAVATVRLEAGAVTTVNFTGI